jgi:hypothetical protein
LFSSSTAKINNENEKEGKNTDFHYLHCNSRFSIIIVIAVVAVTKVSNLWRQKWKFSLLINSVIGLGGWFVFI